MPHRRPTVLVWALILALIPVLGATAGRADAQSDGQADGERITGYDVHITVEDNGSILVRETIDYDFGTSDRHGIFRHIPVRTRYDDVKPGYDRVYPLEVLSVTGSSGTPVDNETESGGDDIELKIGDPDKTITGEHTYVITYRVKGVLNAFPGTPGTPGAPGTPGTPGHVELFWNAVGAGWPVPVDGPRVRVEAPGTISRVGCFAGPERSTTPCSQASVDGSTATFGHGRLAPYEAFTIVVALPPDAVPPPVPILDQRWSLARAFSLTPLTVTGSLALLAVVVAWFAALVWRTGRDRRWVGSETDVAFGNVGGEEQPVPLFEHHRPPVEFVPPDGVRPGQVGTLIDEVANPLDVTATIIDLAVRGYLRIEEVPGEGWRAKPDWELVELKPAEGLLPYEAQLLGALFRDGSPVRLSGLRQQFSARLHKVEDALYDDVVGQGWFASRPDRIRHRWTAIGAAVAVAGGVLVAVTAAWTERALLPLPLLVVGLLLIAGARLMPRRTAKGTGTLRRVLGFRRLIEESEAERARFAEQQHLFSEYLPYAVVFGCTDKWAKAFAGLDGSLPVAGWYVSPHPFTYGAFSHSIDGFSTTTAGSLTSTPAGSGTSGFSGGGFSGGGAGGGGGGSW